MSATPTSTYRLQLSESFGFDAAAQVVPYLARLGISHLYCSPILQAAPGSTHGYDVVDHSKVSADLGGRDGLERLAERVRAHGLGIIVDVVPNHMAMPTPAWNNAALWSVLREGPSSPFATWFDVDWVAQRHAMLMPVLGARIGQVLEADELRLADHDGEPVLRYFDHAFPVRPGTESLPLAELVDEQWYRLANWRVADEELNYRRFFDVDSLMAIRVEDPEVFEATHRTLLDLHQSGVVDGFRIDHPDGLADPREYLRRLAESAPGAWVVVEKILEVDEELPNDWPCAGTTGYDALRRATGVLADPTAERALTRAWEAVAIPEHRDYDACVATSKRHVVTTSLRAEVAHLADLAHTICLDDVTFRDLTHHRLELALVELLVAFGVYRAYVVPGEQVPATSHAEIEAAVLAAVATEPDLTDEVRAVAALASSTRATHASFVRRFQQTSGPVMAKGVEDTAFYRWNRLLALNEVGGDPGRAWDLPDTVHSWARRQQDTWPAAMTTLSTHDTKRSEDTRAQLLAVSEHPDVWARSFEAWQRRGATRAPMDLLPETDYAVWQLTLGAWPISPDRLLPAVRKSLREAKTQTSWATPDEAYEEAVLGYVEANLDDAHLTTALDESLATVAESIRAITLGQKLLQLCLPGVPDVYQACELLDRSLVDPDNRRPVDFDSRERTLALLDGGQAPTGLAEEKLLVTASALRLRRERPAGFACGGYTPLATTTTHAFGFLRGDEVACLLTRRFAALAEQGGWGAAEVVIPAGTWREVLTGREVPGGPAPLATLLDPQTALPVALLVRVGREGPTDQVRSA